MCDAQVFDDTPVIAYTRPTPFQRKCGDMEPLSSLCLTDLLRASWRIWSCRLGTDSIGHTRLAKPVTSWNVSQRRYMTVSVVCE